jgi:hypothetical protein
MKFSIRPALVPGVVMSILTCFGIAGCDPPSAREDADREGSAIAPTALAGSDDAWADTIRDSADAAFASIENAPTRSESRVGPQPWPADLPKRWPRLRDATVVADTKRGGGERLLLANFPGDPDAAMDSIQTAFRDRGYRVEQARSDRTVHARSDDHRVVLTFFPRKKVTRVEILLLVEPAG